MSILETRHQFHGKKAYRKLGEQFSLGTESSAIIHSFTEFLDDVVFWQ